MLDGGKLPCDEGVARAVGAAAPSLPDARRWALVAAVLGSGLSFLLGSAVSVALPAIQADLRATVSGMQWVVSAYTLPLAALLLVGGAAGDRYGRRRVYLVGVSVTAVAALLSSLARSPLELSLGQGMLGLGAALTVPTSLALISAFSPREERGRAIGTWAAFTAVAGAVGPVVGGLLVDSASWRRIFVVVCVGAAVAAALCYRFVPENRPVAVPRAAADAGGRATAPADRPDWPGALLAASGLAAISYAFIAATAEGGAGWRSGAALMGGLVALAAFLRVERGAEGRSPMLPLLLFRSRAFTGANLLTLSLYFALGGAFFFLPFNLIQVQDYSATAAGAAFLPFTVVMGGLSRWAGGLLDRYGAKLPLVVGPAVAAVGFGLFALPGTAGSYWSTFFPPMLVLGIGMAVAVAPLTTVVINAVPDAYAGVASGVNNTASRVAWLLAVAALGVVVQGAFVRHLDAEVSDVALSEAGRSAVVAAHRDLAGVELPEELGEGERAVLEEAVDRAFVGAFRVVMAIAAFLALAGAVVAWRSLGTDRGEADPHTGLAVSDAGD